MKDKYAVWLIAVAALVTSVGVGCHRSGEGVKAKPHPHPYKDDAAIVVVTDPITQQKRAQILVNDFKVHHGQSFKFVTDGCKLELKSPSSGPDGLFKSPLVRQGTSNNYVVTMGDVYAEYEMYATCDGYDVQGSSPPIIIIDN